MGDIYTHRSLVKGPSWWDLIHRVDSYGLQSSEEEKLSICMVGEDVDKDKWKAAETYQYHPKMLVLDAY
jgi:hypothetical protein